MEPVLKPPATESILIGSSPASDMTPLSPAFMAGNSNDYNADEELQPNQLTPPNNILTHLKGDVDPAQATGPLVAYCFMTGLMHVSIFDFFVCII
jgi:hypothetical protein